MATFDQLPADQRAIIELVVQRGQSYGELSDVLGMPERRVRELARDALADLAPSTARRVDDDWRGQVADYVLGQQSGPESTATRGHLRRSEAARSWALSLLDSLDALYGNGARPEIPEAEAAERPRAREPRRPPRERPPRERPARRPAEAGPLSPAAGAVVRRRRIAVAAAVAAVVLFAVLVFPIGLLTGDDDDDGGGGGNAAASQPQLVGSPILLRPRQGEKGAGTAAIAEQEGKRILIVQATGLEPSTQSQDRQNPGTAYEVWLYNSPKDAKSIGAQVTDTQGNYQGAGPLPADFDRYKFLDVSRERIDENTAHSGDSVLRGRVADFAKPPPTSTGGGTGTTPQQP
jgi:hypothetical protein